MKTKTRVIALLVALLSFSVGTTRAAGLAQAEGEAPRLVAVWYDGHRLYRGAFSGVAREVASIFDPLELEIRWQEALEHDPPLDERTILLRIVLTPSDGSGPGWRLRGDVLGAAPPGNGRIRSIYIFYKEVVREVAKGMPNGGILQPPVKLLEKALGRVVAHEMIHAVAPSISHTKRGLMRPAVGSFFLAGNKNVVLSHPVAQAFVAGAESIAATSRSIASELAAQQPGASN